MYSNTVTIKDPLAQYLLEQPDPLAQFFDNIVNTNDDSISRHSDTPDDGAIEIESEDEYLPVQIQPRGNKKHRRKSKEKLKQNTNAVKAKIGTRSSGIIPDEIIHLVMTQYSLKAGREKFGKDADEAILKEFTALHMMETFIPKKRGSLTKEKQK